ncbi:MAG: Ig-like domain-containing protein [Chitinophagaceae bacterium]
MKRLSLLLAVSLLFFCQVARSQTLPSGFSAATIGSGWNMPLGTAFTSDGQKMFVWEKDGRVYVCIRNAAGAYIKQTTPVLDISEEVANWGDHGLMGFALDPNYLSNGLIYLLYVVDRHYLINFGTASYNPATSSTGATIGRITRYKTTTNGSNIVADLSTRFILLGETKQTGICIMHDSHGLGTLAFAADGTLLATAGDGGSYYLVDKGSDTDTDFQTALNDGIIRPAENVGAFRAQILNCHNGKLLRIDPVTGNGVSSNPFYSAAQPRSPKSRVWAFGLRNPYRFSIKPGTGSNNPAAGDVGEVFVGDVGWNTYEEVSIITRGGVNCGWPLFEGLTPQPGYTSAVTANLDEPNPLYGIGGCTKQYFNFQDLVKQVTADNNKTIFNSCNAATPIGTGDRYVHYRPAIEWKHFTNEARVGTFSGNTATVAIIGTPESNVIGAPFPGNCSTGGPWYNGSNFPATYQNKYFVADHDGQWIKCFSVDFTDVVTEVKNFGTGFLGTVNVNVNPLDGTLVVVELGNFSSIGPAIKQITYGGNQFPVVRMSSDKTFGPSPLNVNFTGSTSSDPDGTIASYAWNFGDGGTSTLANPSHNFTAAGNTPTRYVVKLTVTDNLGASSLDSIIISVNNTPPVVNITSPAKNSLYKVGPDTLYTLAATVTDAEPGALKYEWQTFLRHNSHVHPEGISTAVSPTSSISRIGCNGDTYYWFIKLTVTDAAGLSTVDSSKIFPDCSVGADITPPIVSSVSPLSGATGVSTGTVVSAVFNETIDPVSITAATFQLKDAANNIIPGSINTSFNQITFTPSVTLAGSTVYTVIIKSGASGVKDLAGNALASDYSWSFTTAAVDNTPPTITTVSPVNGATGIVSGTTVTANFNEAINATTVTGSTVQVRDAGNNLIAATINVSGSQVTLTPSAALSGLTVYTVTITGGTSGVKDLAGNALANNYVWSFTTAAVDNTAPTVTTVSPLNAATGVVVGTTVTANFSETINASTVTTSTFQLRDPANTLIAATVSLSGNQIILTPTLALAGSTEYTATITGGGSGVKDLAGNALATNYSWSFTTVVSSTQPVTIQSANTKTGTAATVHALTGVPAGALLVLTTTSDAVVSNCTVTCTPALTWTKRVDAGATSSDNAEIWTAAFTAGGTISVTSNWGDASQTSVCFVVLNAEPTLSGAFATATLQTAPSVTVTTTRDNSIIFGCTADWKAVNGATRTLRDAAIEALYFRDGNYATYHYTKTATSIAAYTEGISLPTGQQASTALLEIRGNGIIPPTVTTQPAPQIKCAGANASFTSAATGIPVPTVQWQESTNGTSWTNITGATSATLSFVTTIADNNKQYRAVWTNSGVPVNSNPAALTVNAIPTTPAIDVVNNCGNSVLTASGIAGSLLWSNGATTSFITVTTGGTYTATQTVNGCTSGIGSGIATPLSTPSVPSIDVVNNCDNSVLTASGFTGSLLWSNGETTASITVTTGGTYTVTQTVSGCVSANGSAVAAPKTNPLAPSVSVANNCGNSVLTASGFTGLLQWNTGATTNSITVTTDGTYTVTQTVNGCTSETGSGLAAPLNSVVATPTIAVVDDCGSSTLTAEGFTGTLLWSTGATTPSINVTTGGTYTVTQKVNGCNSAAGNGIAAPKVVPAKPIVGVTNNCERSTLTISNVNGSLLWNTGETSTSISVVAAGTYTVTQTLDGCTSTTGSAVASPNAIPSAPLVTVLNNCGNSVLTASGFTGSLLWSTGETAASITVTTGGTYTVSQVLIGCTSAVASVIAAPRVVPPAPIVTELLNCGNSVLTASGYTGSLLWNTGETTESISVTVPGNYLVTQTVDGCQSNMTFFGGVNPRIIPPAPIVTTVNNCGNSVLTASGFTGSLLWSTGETTSSITVTTGGTYWVMQIVNGCSSPVGNGVAEPVNSVVATPTIMVVDNCGHSVLTAEEFTGTLLWSTGEITPSITVTNAGSYTVVQKVNGCSSAPANGIAVPKIIPAAPVAEVVNNCGSSALTASGFTGSLLWSTAETTSAIAVTIPGTYTVTQTLNGCTSSEGSITASPKIKPAAPFVTVVNNCGHSVLTASGFTGSLLWSNGATTSSITVNVAGIYTVTQTISGCISDNVSGTAAPFNAVVDPPVITVADNCSNSILTAESFTGSLLWSNGATTSSITVSTPGTYSVTQTLNGCTSAAANGTAVPLSSTIIAPTVSIVDNCGNSVLTASGFTGTLLWSNGATTSNITVATAGTYTVTQTVNGCTGATGTGIAAIKIIPSAPNVSIVNNCGNSVLTASGFTGSLLWSNGATTASITVTTGGTYTVTQTINGCTSETGSGVAAPKEIPTAPTVSVVDNCGNSTLTAGPFAGSLLWSNAATTNAITVNTASTYTVTQTLNGCTSGAGSGVAAPKAIPVLSGSLVATATSGIAFTYTANSSAPGTTFGWSRAAVTGISNSASSGTGNINETLVNTLSTPVNVTYVYALSADGCTNTQNVVVSVSSAPAVTSVSPVNGATGVSISSPVTANFSEAINATTVTVTTFQLKDAANNIIPATLNTSSAIITLTPSSALISSTTYTVTIKGGVSGVKGLAGNAMINDYTWSFTTATVVSQPVAIQSSNTKTGTAATVHSLTGVPAGALLVLTTTSDAVVSNCTVTSTPSLTWTKRVDAGAASSDNAEIWTAVYSAGGAITVTSNWGAVSQASVCYVVLNAEPTLSGAFATATLQAAPSVAITTTRDNSILFGCTADWKAINGATRTLRDAATERLYFRDANYTTYHYTKASALTGAYTEGVSVPTGQQSSTAVLEIRGVSTGPDLIAPTVTSVSPANGATGVLVGSAASVLFSEAMDATTINSSNIELRNASNVLVTAFVSYNAGTRTASITPSAALANSTVYTAKVKSGTSGVKDVAGNALATDYSWSFTTEVGDIIPPTVTSVTPLNGATGVSISTAATAIFNEAMDATTINSSTIELRNASNVLITATVSFNAATRTATVTPSAALSISTVYTATIKGGAAGVKDVAGNALAVNYSWSFTTANTTSAPPVIIQSFTTKTGTAATVHSLTAVPAGALLVLATTSDAVVSDCIVSSTPALTWTKRVDAGATSSDNAEIWTAVYTAGGSITVTGNWGAVSQTSVCYVVLNAEPTLGGAFGTATLQAAPSVTVTTTRDNSIIFGCTADWKAINGATRTLRDAATERLYFRDGNYTTYHYTKATTTIAAYTEGVSAPTGQQASTALLEIRGATTLLTRPANPALVPALTGSDLLEVKVMPNPSNTFFSLVIKANSNNPVQVRVTDLFGRVVERFEKIAGNTTLRIGHRWSAGSYFVEIIQADQRKFVKIIKVN